MTAEQNQRIGYDTSNETVTQAVEYYQTRTEKDLKYETLVRELQIAPRINYEGIMRNIGSLQVANYTANSTNVDNRNIEKLLTMQLTEMKKQNKRRGSGRGFGNRWRN